MDLNRTGDLPCGRPQLTKPGGRAPRIRGPMNSLLVTCHVLLLATTVLHGACGADGQGQQQSLKDAGAPSPLRSTGPPRFQNYHDGVWAAPHVPAWRVGQARVFEPSASHRVAVMPLPNHRHFHALRQIASDCDAGWEPLLSYNDEDIPTFACKPTPVVPRQTAEISTRTTRRGSCCTTSST